MKRTILLFLLAIASGFASGQNWTSLVSGTTSNLKAIHFPALSTGYACGDAGKVIKTINGGITWTDVSPGFAGYWFWDIHFVDAGLGYVVGESDPGYNPCGQGIILKTVNGGTSWTVLAQGLGFPVRDLFVLNHDTLFVCGGAESNTSLIRKSTDGGNTWIQIGLTYFDAMLGGMFFLNADTGFLGMYESVYGTYNPTLTTWLSTSDGGLTFYPSVVPGSASYWNFAADFPDPLHGFMSRSTYVSTMPVYVRNTADGGITWTENMIPSFSGCIYGLDFVNTLNGCLVGAAGTILRTSDGGSSWTAQSSGTAQELRSVFFVNPNLGFTAGANGTILKWEGEPTGLAQSEAGSPEFSIAGDPGNGMYQVSSPHLRYSLLLTSISGQVMRTQTVTSGKAAIELSPLPVGIYILVLTTENARMVRKLIRY